MTVAPRGSSYPRDRLYVAPSKSVVAVDARGQAVWRPDMSGSLTARAGLGLPGAVAQQDFYDA